MTPLPKRRWSTLRQGRRRSTINLNLPDFSTPAKRLTTKKQRKSAATATPRQ